MASPKAALPRNVMSTDSEPLQCIGGVPLVVLLVEFALKTQEPVVMVAGVVCLRCSNGRWL